MWWLSNFFSKDQLLDKCLQATLMNGVFLRKSICFLYFTITNLGQIWVIIACCARFELFDNCKIFGPNFVKLALLLCFLLLHGFVDNRLFQHLTEALIKRLQSEISWRVGLHAPAAERRSRTSFQVLDLIASRVDTVRSLRMLHLLAPIGLLRDLNGLSILWQVLALQTLLLHALQLRRVCLVGPAWGIPMLVGDLEVPVAIIWLPFTPRDDHPPVEVLLHRNLAVTLAMINTNACTCSKLPWIALAFAPASALVAGSIFWSVVQIIERTESAIGARGPIILMCLGDCSARLFSRASIGVVFGACLSLGHRWSSLTSMPRYERVSWKLLLGYSRCISTLYRISLTKSFLSNRPSRISFFSFQTGVVCLFSS